MRAWLAGALRDAGLQHIEAAAFVSPKAVPSMAAAADVIAALDHDHATTWWALVPNAKGAELALAASIDHLTVTISASPVYNEKNVGMTVAQSVDQIRMIRSVAGNGTVDAVVSCAFGSSFGDGVTVSQVAELCRSLRDLGMDQLTLADTTGTATPRRVEAVVAEVGSDIGLHFHDTRGTALTNAYAALGLGVRRFDTAIGGLGGSPFAPGAGGNLATEDLVLLLEDLGIDTGVDLAMLLDVSHELGHRLGHDLPSRVGKSGGLPAFET